MLDNQLFTELTPEEGSQLAGGQFTIELVDLGPIPEPPAGDVTAERANPTAIGIVNETGLELNYGLNYGQFEDVIIPAGETINHFGQTELAAVGWDKDLRLPDTQLNVALMEPGNQYAFRQV